VDCAAADLACHRIAKDIQQGCGFDRQRQGMTAARRRIGPGAGGERQEGAGAHVRMVRRVGPFGALQRRAVAAAQQPGDGLQRLGLGQADGVAAPVEQPPSATVVISEASTGSPQAMAPAATSETCGCGSCAAPARDVGRPIEAAARVAGIGPHLHAAAADVGVERLRAHAQAVPGFLGGDPIGRRHILITLIKIDGPSLDAFLSSSKQELETSMSDGLEDVVAADTVLSEVDGKAGHLIIRGLTLDELADAPASKTSSACCSRASSRICRRT
jgi:hypothetical protein